MLIIETSVNISQNMILNSDNPVYNTIIIFSVIMLLLYTIKPDVIYDNEKNEFRQFGTTDGKTLLPIYVVGMLLAIILYVFFYYLAQKLKKNKIEIIDKENSIINYQSIPNLIPNLHANKNIQIIDKTENITNTANDESYKYYIQQQIQLQNIQNQLNQLVVQQQVSTHTLKNKLNFSDSILPNCLNV
jgi:heme/copper-type cytochrome/quinol oxidase subunit 1